MNIRSALFTLLLALGNVTHAQVFDDRRENISASELIEAESLIKDTLKDPDSAKIRDVYAIRSSTGHTLYCGELNAKNSYGGYNGFSQFLYNPTGSPKVATSNDRIGSIIVSSFCKTPPVKQEQSVQPSASTDIQGVEAKKSHLSF